MGGVTAGALSASGGSYRVDIVSAASVDIGSAASPRHRDRRCGGDRGGHDRRECSRPHEPRDPALMHLAW